MSHHGLETSISLSLMPAFFCKHVGVTYGEAYYFDPGYRATVDKAEQKFMFEVLGRYGVGNPNPVPSPSLFIQPVDLVMGTQGAQWRFPSDGTVESWGTPWAGKSPAEIARIDPQEAAHHPIIEAVVRQYRELSRLYGEKADIFGIKTGLMNVHSPYTTAHQLCGEDLFCQMVAEPQDSAVVLGKIWEIYQAIFERLRKETGGRLAHLHIGDCSASLISESLYRDVVLPMNRKIMTGFSEVSYHSCGPSTHLLDAFARLAPLSSIELGPGTNLAQAAALLPDTKFCPLVDPLIMQRGSTDDVRQLVSGLLIATAAAPSRTLCAWSFDRETPVDNVVALYETVHSDMARTLE